MKRIVFLLLISMVSLPAFASVSDWIQAANFLASKAIIADHSSLTDEYRVHDSLTRKETMKIVAKLAGATPEDVCEGKFSDVPKDWACKYIEWALNNGYITQSDKFRPEDNITKVEALKLIFKARGIEKAYSSKSWQADYYNTAILKGLVNTAENDGSYNDNAPRGWIFYASARTYDEFKIAVISDEAQ